MKYKQILVTGGAGFVGSNISVLLKTKYPKTHVIALDNLVRRGSELNITRLKDHGITFVHGDVRNKEDLEFDNIDLLIECSAEPSVMAGVDSSPEYLLNTNLLGAINCFELARRNSADIVFLSTSRVYPIKTLNQLAVLEKDTRFELDNQEIQGASKKGISEAFPLSGVRSLYGATKLSAELLLQEYCEVYGLRGIINRCGVLTGPWQMGKVDQGVIVLWMARHYFNKNLSYIGFKGSGKQVRDILHVRDLFQLIEMQLENIEDFSGKVMNVGGGVKNSISLLELTEKCQELTGNTVTIHKDIHDRPGDIKVYISDNTEILE